MGQPFTKLLEARRLSISGMALVCQLGTRLLRLEAQIAMIVLERMLLNDMVYISPDIVHGQYVFFAVNKH